MCIREKFSVASIHFSQFIKTCGVQWKRLPNNLDPTNLDAAIFGFSKYETTFLIAHQKYPTNNYFKNLKSQVVAEAGKQIHNINPEKALKDKSFILCVPSTYHTEPPAGAAHSRPTTFTPENVTYGEVSNKL